MRRSWLRLFWLCVVLVAAIGGYLVSSGLGTRLLHREIETQLARILDGPVSIGEVELRWNDGLSVVGREISAYPSPVAGEPAILRANRVVAWVDGIALLVGRLELSTLVLEGPHVRLVQRQDGSFVGLPLPRLAAYPDEGLDDRTGSEGFFARLGSLEPNATALAERIRIADRIEVIDGTLSWSSHGDGEAASEAWRIELLEGVAERDWLSDAVTLDAGGVFVDGEHAPFPFSARIARAENARFAWSLSLSQIPLAAAETPLGFIEGLEALDRLSGTLDAEFSLTSPGEGEYRLAIDGKIAEATIVLRGAQTILDSEPVALEAELTFDPHRVRLRSSRLAGETLRLEFKGQIERPIRPASRTRIESRTTGVELEGVREFAKSLASESTTARAISRMMERVESGHIRYIEASGTTRLSRWQALSAGQSRTLPDGFVLGGAFDGIDLAGRPENRLEDLEGVVEWVGDQIALRNGNAIYRGRPLPELEGVLDGVAELVEMLDRDAVAITRETPDIPGLVSLSQIIKPRDPDQLPPVEAAALAVDVLEHPIFHWPLHDVRMLVEPLRRGLQISLREGYWGGASVSGEVVWFNDPEKPSVSANLSLAPARDPAALAASVAAAGRLPEARWGAGRFEMSFRPRPWLPFEKATGYLRLDGTDLLGDELEIDVAPEGKAALRVALGLESRGSIGFDVSFALTDGQLGPLGPFVALPEDLATGRIGATGSLGGRLRPDTRFISDLSGKIRAEAKDGRVRTTLPLLFRLAKATEGFNPFAKKDRLQYEAMSGTFDLYKGLISVGDFEIEGPLRVYARADIDTNEKPADIRAVVGIFLFRKPNQVLDNLPILRSFLPGSERGLIGTYFDVVGPLASPRIEPLPLETLMTGVPNAIKAPFKALRLLFSRPKETS